MMPQNIGFFCVGIAKAYYASPKSKKIAVVPIALVQGVYIKDLL